MFTWIAKLILNKIAFRKIILVKVDMKV